MGNKTYEQRLSDLATEMAREYHKQTRYLVGFHNQDWDMLPQLVKNNKMEICSGYAAIALKHMAEEYIEGCNTIILDKYEIERNLINRGLDPQKP